MFDPRDKDALLGLPDELRDGSLYAMQPVKSSWSENRTFLFNVLHDIHAKGAPYEMTSRQVWETLVPFRPRLSLFGSADPESARVPYDWVIDSLDDWFSRAPITRAEYVQWSLAALIDVMLGKDLGGRSGQFSAANRVMEDILCRCTPSDIKLLQNLLMQSPLSTPAQAEVLDSTSPLASA